MIEKRILIRKIMHHVASLALTIFLVNSTAALAESAVAAEKSRVVVLTDIGNEPDDAESFVRFLLYANEFDIEGLVATTSNWQRTKVQPQLLHERIAAYGEVLRNLRQHASGYPDAETLQNLVFSGVAEFGMKGVGEGKGTAASERIISAVDGSKRPLWVLAWGGAADLAQALWTVRATRSAEEQAAFVSKLRIYSISDQDNAGPWIRRNFPQAFFIASVHGWNQYNLATWTGISGDLLNGQQWPGKEFVTNAWLEKHIRKGALGELYPPHVFIMEGDTPSFLGLIPNGLNLPERPEAGGWGGRYIKTDPTAMHYGDTQDKFIDASGTVHVSNQASIFRWRKAFQQDFAARMNWTLAQDYTDANHHPELAVNGIAGLQPVTIAAKPGDTISVTAEGSSDPDGDTLMYRWWKYDEAEGKGMRPQVPVTLHNDNTSQVQVELNEDAPAGTYHIILEATDNGTPALTRYRRVLVQVAAAKSSANNAEIHQTD